MQPAPEAPAVAICRAPLFNPSETFVRAHALGLVRYRPVLVGIEDKGDVPAELRDALVVPRSPVERVPANIAFRH